MMIDDEELRDVFKVASEEHLQNLDDGLLHLENHPNDLAVLEALMREAHSLKGDANMLGVKDVGTLAHQIEHILTQLKQQENPASSLGNDTTDSPYERLAHAIAAIRKLVHEAVTGEPARVDTFSVLAELMGAPSVKKEDNPSQEPEVNSIEVINTVKNNTFDKNQELKENATIQNPKSKIVRLSEAEVQNPKSPTNSYRIETIRVGTRHLDTLMTQAGELTVTKIRIAHRLGEIEAIANLWEEWNRDLFTNRFAFSREQQGDVAHQRLETFHHHSEKRLEQLGHLVKTLQSSLSEDTTRLEQLSSDLEEGIRTLRLLPFATIFNLFPRMVRDLAQQQGKLVELILEGKDTLADKRLLEEMKDPLMHILRNAIDHGIEPPQERERLGKPTTATIRLKAYQTPTNIVLEISDDGRGLDLDRIKQIAVKRGICGEEELAAMTPSQIQALIFAPGFSTAPLVTEISGRGVGLDVVQTNVEKLKGTIQVESFPGQGCTLRVNLSITLATAHVLIVQVNEMPYAIPVEFVQTACLIKSEEIFPLEGRDTIIRDSQPISIVQLADLLELPPMPSGLTQETALSCIILQVGQAQLGVVVDALVDEQDILIKPQSQLLKRVRNVSGATILGTGDVCMVLNPQDLVKSARSRSQSISSTQTRQLAPTKPTVLLVEDSIATRTQEKRILETAGYQVITAVDGLDGFNKLRSHAVDAVVSDVQMPNLDGFGLTAKIRQYQEYSELPIILVTSLASDEDKRRGAEAGANAYIIKGSFNQEALLSTLKRLV
ncbi:hybrid sensor histidine kinase/response regulator [Nostoc sp. 'Peltigera membranacea cyanobiont' 213]|uniref:hybrid sensor histidine kinase/response regulator n=1 Tax=Nostoc sp. 'Peltigera membranacea cyanobiont' 213 TaxID=2014530 RepID=UPI000B954A47|nr:hybrid sensor histidine kinase/response regulator [Nostoc sp. 'Peltigera membranacea cyanobiont' 213]OYD88946.1 hybrid sensor histidine kinase/response regulator [Nostoc sp. 'Peltigera membranacea cyanobiont' 213]